jgi:hypothetical protein
MSKIIESATWTSLEKKTGTSILLSKTGEQIIMEEIISSNH